MSGCGLSPSEAVAAGGRDVNLDFFVIGAHKSGTTALCKYIGAHPDLLISRPKETRYFGSSQFRADLRGYIGRFVPDAPRGQTATGDGDPDNLILPHVPSRIVGVNPAARLIVILRDPASRAAAHWWMDYSQGLERLEFGDAITNNFRSIQRDGLAFDSGDPSRAYDDYHRDRRRRVLRKRLYIDVGFYSHWLKNYVRHFDPSQIHIIFADDFARDTESCLHRLYSFLGVGPLPDMPRLKGGGDNRALNSRRIGRMQGAVTSIGTRSGLGRLLPSRFKEDWWPRVWSILGGLAERNGNKVPSELIAELRREYVKDLQSLAELFGRWGPGGPALPRRWVEDYKLDV